CAVEAVRVAFKAEGFGVLTEIDVSATMKAKLDADMPPYLILGMCNPQLAHRALMQETDIGVMLPCNVAVYEAEGHVVVAAQDPRGIVSMTGNDKLNEMADEAESRIRRAIKSLG
ncbi:MAG: DUF302 domain-containing protein, partial [Armatimonadetes bacterium]|nr:DUF302 domain-containing protein [Armatimonadota bacterium]